MHGVNPKDGNRKVDWSAASRDYALHRPGFPESFYAKLQRFGIGLPSQRILDLGTGTGTVARQFAAYGSQVVGVDIAAGQIAEAKRLAKDAELEVDFRTCSAEETQLPDNSFDIVIAAQCWLYFERDSILSEVKRLLDSGGRLITCHLSWLPRIDKVAQATEALIRKHNPDWSANDWDGVVPIFPAWLDEPLKVQTSELEAMFYYDEYIPFTHKSWRGRIRASRGVSATLSEENVRKFDIEHEELLRRITPETFGVIHRIDAHIFKINDSL